MTRTEGAANWSTDREERLRHLWETEGLSSGDIAWEMGVTRNAVIGKVARMKLARRERRVAAKRPLPDRNRRTDREVYNRIKHKAQQVPLVGDTRALRGKAWAPLAGSNPVTLLDLVPGMCKWPIGDGKPYLFCGCPANPEQPYCEHHRSISVRKVVEHV